MNIELNIFTFMENFCLRDCLRQVVILPLAIKKSSHKSVPLDPFPPFTQIHLELLYIFNFFLFRFTIMFTNGNIPTIAI